MKKYRIDLKKVLTAQSGWWPLCSSLHSFIPFRHDQAICKTGTLTDFPKIQNINMSLFDRNNLTVWNKYCSFPSDINPTKKGGICQGLRQGCPLWRYYKSCRWGYLGAESGNRSCSPANNKRLAGEKNGRTHLDQICLNQKTSALSGGK